jgi:hypothetical protein
VEALASRPATFAIARSRESVLVGGIGLLACLAFAFLLLLLAVLPFLDPASADVPYAVRAASLVAAGAITWLGIWILRYSLGRWTRGQVKVEADRLVIEHEDTFKQPLEVPRAAVRLAVVDARGAGRLGDSEQILPEGVDERLRWTHLPFISSHADLEVPNVALLFEKPVAAPAIRHQRLHGPLEGEALAGIKLRVEDPAALELSLAAWGCLREPRDADVKHVDRLLGQWDGREPPNARRPLWLDRLAKGGWLMAPASLVFPWLLGLAVPAALVLISHRRWAGWALLLACAGAGYLAVLIR